MFRFKKSFCLALTLGMAVPVCSNAANFCIAVNGGSAMAARVSSAKGSRSRPRAHASRGPVREDGRQRHCQFDRFRMCIDRR
jgi:hypothetical protein